MTQKYLLFVQHGWANNNKEIKQLADKLSTNKTIIVAPSLGWLKTWIRIEPLITKLEQIVIKKREEYPNLQMRIIGHSMGGLIWLELLKRHPEWHNDIHSLILIASPIGGADLARIIDPFGIGIGIARDLGINRRFFAESIAQIIPTLVIAGDIDNGSDGTITMETTKFNYANFICLKGIAHSKLKNHPSLVPIIQDFWQNPVITSTVLHSFPTNLINDLRSISGITDAHYRDFQSSKLYLSFNNGIYLKTWQNFWGVNHVFIGNKQNECLYAGFVGWLDNQNLYDVLDKIQEKYSTQIIVQ